MTKPKLKAKTLEQALSVAEHGLSEKASELEASRRVALQLDALVSKLRARNDALEWALVLAQDVCRQRETELRQKDGDKLALAG